MSCGAVVITNLNLVGGMTGRSDGFFSFEDAAGVQANWRLRSRMFAPLVYGLTGFDKLMLLERRHLVMCCQRDKLDAPR